MVASVGWIYNVIINCVTTATRNVREYVVECVTPNVQFRWIQYNTTYAPAWAIDDIIIDCLLHFYKSISFEELPK